MPTLRSKRVVVALIGVLMLMALPALAGTFNSTYINCTFTVNTDFVPSPGQAFSATQERDSGCASGTNVKTQPRALVSGTWYYGSQVTDADDAISVFNPPGYVVDSQGRGQGRNATPDSWSGWTAYGG